MIKIEVEAKEEYFSIKPQSCKINIASLSWHL
jgi:hypothetical protein